MEDIPNIFKRKYKYAADYGFILGGYIALFTILIFLFPKSIFANTLNFVGLMGTPYLCFVLSAKYRDKAWGGYIRFGQVWSFGILLFLFASLLMSVLYFVHTMYIDTDFLTNRFNENIRLLEGLQVPKENAEFKKEIMAMFVANGVPTPIQYVFEQIWSYICGGAILFLFISPFIMRKRPIEKNNMDQPYEPYKESEEESKS